MTVFLVYGELREKISSKRQLCGQKCFVEGRMAHRARKAMIAQVTTSYNQGK